MQLEVLLTGVGTIISGLLLWGLQALIKAVFDNTRALDKLTIRLEELTKETGKIPRLERLIGEAHAKIRGLKDVMEE